MRHRLVRRHPRRVLTRVLTGVAALCAVFSLGLVACGMETGADRPVVTAPAPGERAPAPSGGPLAAPLPRSEPVKIQIPSLGVTSELMDLGLQADGTMEVPPGAYPAGWYTGAPSPGELGPAVIAGHVNWAGKDGVFSKLTELKPGDQVAVARQDGTTALFRVDRVAEYPKHQFPTEAVYGNIDHAGLRLITCGGDFDREAHSYEDNIVVYASLVGSAAV
ncbi:class F sortase [Pseudonocardia xinjiangensis]|uniref:Class F sortase n=1 Tax=Pseudonocardia xinjiangensis TaxID=75289 RepID=A0ABX1RAU3_9PSEU|nr:class F sortase [Pseudonocardia xinjiangensis]